MFRSYQLEVSKDNNMSIEDMFELIEIINNKDISEMRKDVKKREILNVILLKIFYNRIEEVADEDDIVPLRIIKSNIFGTFIRDRNRPEDNFTEYIYNNQGLVDEAIRNYSRRYEYE